MKVIFLDIDGVLNSGQTLVSGFDLYKDYLLNLKELVNKTGAKIVLMSSWRNFIKRGARGVFAPTYRKGRGYHPLGNLLLFTFALHGLSLYDKVSDVELSSSNRGQDILKWLETHPQVTSFVILDDCVFDFEECGLLKYLVRTNAGESRNTPFDLQGFNRMSFLKALEILNK